MATDNLNIEHLCKPFKNLLFQNYSTEFLDIAHKYSNPWVCVIKVCSNGDAIYIIDGIIAKDSLNIAN